jgi:hypothetical protein
MNFRDQFNLSDEQYGLLFGVRRSVRYHDRRRAFYERCHQVTSVLTILMAGSVLFELGKTGEVAGWLKAISVLAALMAALDMVVGYAKRAINHGGLRERFALLEIAMIDGGIDEDTWLKHQRERLMIEKDEPPIYKVLDLLCHNELAEAEGYKRSDSPECFFTANWWQRFTSQIFRWENTDITTDKTKGKGDKISPCTEAPA